MFVHWPGHKSLGLSAWYDAQLRFGLFVHCLNSVLGLECLAGLPIIFHCHETKPSLYIKHTRLLLLLRRRHINPNSCRRRGQSIGLYLITLIFLLFVFEFEFCVWLSSDDEFLMCLTLSCDYRSNFRSFINYRLELLCGTRGTSEEVKPLLILHFSFNFVVFFSSFLNSGPIVLAFLLFQPSNWDRFNGILVKTLVLPFFSLMNLCIIASLRKMAHMKSFWEFNAKQTNRIYSRFWSFWH